MGVFARPADWPITPVWIETGVGHGGSVAAALEIGYPVVISIEFDARLYSAAAARFAGRRARFYSGSSPDALRVILDPRESVTFWLDAHYSGPGPWAASDPAYGECPLLAELAVIAAAPWRTPPLIAIDDAEMFERLPDGFRREDWPGAGEIRAALIGWAVRREGDALYCTPRG